MHSDCVQCSNEKCVCRNCAGNFATQNGCDIDDCSFDVKESCSLLEEHPGYKKKVTNDEDVNMLKDAAHMLAMYVLQSNLYSINMDIRDAVNHVLSLTILQKGDDKHDR